MYTYIDDLKASATVWSREFNFVVIDYISLFMEGVNRYKILVHLWSFHCHRFDAKSSYIKAAVTPNRRQLLEVRRSFGYKSRSSCYPNCSCSVYETKQRLNFKIIACQVLARSRAIHQEMWTGQVQNKKCTNTNKRRPTHDHTTKWCLTDGVCFKFFRNNNLPPDKTATAWAYICIYWET